MRLSHNLSSLKAYQSYTKSLKANSQALNNISTGSKLNKAGDHPNKIVQSEKFKLQVRALNMASRNAQDGVSMIQSAEGSLDSITQQLQRARELIVQGGGTLAENDLGAINAEINQMIEGVDTTSKNNEFNGVNIIGGELENSLKMPVGSDIGEEIEIPVNDFTAKGLGLVDQEGKVTVDANNIDDSLNIIDGALDKVISARSKYGAISNTFESKHEALTEISSRIEGADARISGADIAFESLEYSRSSILIEAGIGVLAQSNKMPQDALRILENIK